MKTYPSIPTKINFKHDYYVFNKIDGSNIRAEWSDKRGFYKFGSRNQLLSEQQTALYPSIDIIKRKYEEELGKRFEELKMSRGICFFEYYGPNSFAGSHNDPVEDMDAVIIDVNPYKKGILPPEQFLEFCEGMETPDVLYKGKIDGDLIEQVRESELDGITLEGVVIKAKEVKHNGMAKIKTRKWLDMLKEYCDNDSKMFNRLK